jgi:hypothetical protein
MMTSDYQAFSHAGTGHTCAAGRLDVCVPREHSVIVGFYDAKVLLKCIGHFPELRARYAVSDRHGIGTS